jgi:hypothetical protein
MGCDIHIVIERQDESGAWQIVPYVEEPPPWLNDDDYGKSRHAEVNARVAAGAGRMPHAFGLRDYDLFGIIGDVRNGSGLQDGLTWPSIAPSRGFPADTLVKEGETVRDEDNGEWTGDHSFTWVSLDELAAFPWDDTTRVQHGLIGYRTWAQWKATGGKRPAGWCQGTNSPIMTELEAIHAQYEINPRQYVRCYWSETAREATGDWAGKVLPKLMEIAAGRPLRLLVGFDS